MSRVGLVVHGQPPELVGGTERLVAQLAGELAARGQTVEVFTGSIEWRPRFEVVRDESGPVPVVRVHRHDLFFERWDKVANPFVARAYAEWLDRFAPDVVHVHHWARLTTDLVRIAARRGHATVLSLHDLFASCPRYHRVKEDLSFCTVSASPEACRHCAPRWAFQADAEIDRSVARFASELRREVGRAHALVVPTEGHGRRVLGWLGLQREMHVLPPPGSETALAGALERARRPLGEERAGVGRPLRAGVFGHLHPLKGVGVLLDAQAALDDPSLLEVHVWGTAPVPEMDAALRARAGHRAVVWHGAYRPEDLSGAPIDVAVLPTLCAESYSLALDEAAALGVPVLASDLGALSDRATPRMALFPRGDAAALARLLDDLGRRPERRRAMREAAAPAASDLPRHLEALGGIYRRALAAAAAAPHGPAPREPDEEAAAAAEHAFALREAGLAELLRSEGWEQVVARLEAEAAELRRRLAERG